MKWVGYISAGALGSAFALLILYRGKEDVPGHVNSTPHHEPDPAPVEEFLERNDVTFRIQWLSDVDSAKFPVKDTLSKARVKNTESFVPRQVNSRQEAYTYLVESISFAKRPKRACESLDFFFFSAPSAQDFSSGIIISKKTGEISIW